MIKDISKGKGWYLLAIPLVAYVAIALYPILLSGFYSDDILFAQGTRGLMLYEHKSLFEIVSEDIVFWMGSARFQPLYYLEQRLLFYYFPDAVSHKAVIYVLNVLAVFSFGGFLYLLQKNKKLVWLTLLILPAFFQFRVMDADGYTTFNGSFQITAILNFAALSSFVVYLRRRRWYFLAGTTVLLAMAFCFSEMTLVFIPLYLVVTLLLNRHLKINLLYVVKRLATVAIVSALYLGILIWLRVDPPVQVTKYDGLEVSLDGSEMLDLVHAQIISAIPMSYMNYEKNFKRVDPQLIFAQIGQHAPVVAMVLLVLLYVFFYGKYRQLPVGEEQNLRLFLWIGILLLLLPAMLIMPSAKYQKYIRPGGGYIPVYLQNLGGAILFALLMHVLLGSAHRLKRYVGMLLLVVLMLVVPLTLGNNMRQIANQNARVHYPSLALEHALADGLMDGVGDNSLIWFAHNHHWGGTEHYMHLIFERTGKRVEVTNLAGPYAFAAGRVPVYQLSFPVGAPNVVTLAKVLDIDSSGAPILDTATVKRYEYWF